MSYLLTDKFDLFYDAYVECALWTEGLTELTPQEEFQMLNDCMEFMTVSYHLINKMNLSQCGHDFWLTRNGHGSGFWDRGYSVPIAAELEAISKRFGTFDLIKEVEE